MDKISIVIPIYNVQDYIGRCLNSILNQTYTNFEAICVNDGSSDMSGKICEQYSKKDARIRVYHISNGGVGNARNYGLSVISGEWFAFVDADDWLEPNYLEVLYNSAINQGCEISACCFKRNDLYCLHECAAESAEIHIFNSPAECIHAYICPSESLYGMVWNKLYKSELFQNIRFEVDVKVNEDCIYTQCVMEKCRKACRTNLELYHWFYRDDSACHSRNIEPDFSAADVFYSLLIRNQGLNDVDVNRQLKKNYVLCVIKTLLYSKYDKHADCVKQAVYLCQEWVRDIWRLLNKKEKAKYCIVFYLPLIKNPVVKLFGKRKD